jgi:lipoprotein-anchoring transpeptidase ErfK/SrfK
VIVTRYGWILGVAALVAAFGIGIAFVWPSSAQQSAANPLPAVAPAAQEQIAAAEPVADEEAVPEFTTVWVAPFAPTDLWIGQGAEAESAESVPVGIPLEVLAPQRSSRLNVRNPVTDTVGWVDAAAVGPVPEPTADEIAALQAPPPFEPYWAMTVRPAVAWSSPEDDARAFNRIPQWRYLQVVMRPEGTRAYTFDPRTEAYAYVDMNALGGVPAPPDEYLDPGTPTPEQTLALPGRGLGSAAGAGYNQPVIVDEEVDRGSAGHGFRLGNNTVPTSSVRVPTLPQRTFPGRWIDANLSEPVLVTAYQDDQAIYSAMAVKGVIGFLTPTGVFRILRRVANETMDSLTLGIPRNSPNGYYLRNVLYTQYFTPDGAAIHYNYWLARWGYGGSHGCLGMNLDDSKFFWDFADVGTPVYVHY